MSRAFNKSAWLYTLLYLGLVLVAAAFAGYGIVAKNHMNSACAEDTRLSLEWYKMQNRTSNTINDGHHIQRMHPSVLAWIV